MNIRMGLLFAASMTLASAAGADDQLAQCNKRCNPLLLEEGGVVAKDFAANIRKLQALKKQENDPLKRKHLDEAEQVETQKMKASVENVCYRICGD